MRIVADQNANKAVHVVWQGERAASGGRSVAAGRRPAARRAIPRATSLAVRSDDPHKIVVARRPMGAWTSIYSATAPLAASFLKQLAAEAGVHIYDPDPTHLLFANRRFLTVCANDQGGPACHPLAAPGLGHRPGQRGDRGPGR